MSNNTDTKLMYVKLSHFTQRDYAWMMATFILTPLAAATLAITGYIQTSPMIAAIDGLLVSFMYVGFRVVNAMRRLRLYKQMLAKRLETDSTPE